MAILRSEEGRLWRVWPQGTILPSRLSLRGYHCMCQFGDPIHVMGIHHSRQHWQYGLWVGWQAGHVACHGLRGIAGKWDAWGFFLAQSWPLQRCIDLTEKDSEGLQAYKRSRTPFCRHEFGNSLGLHVLRPFECCLEIQRSAVSRLRRPL